MYKWQQIFNDLLGRISSGDLAPGSRLPSEADLSEQYDVTHSTVRRALLELRIEGLVMPRQGAGVVVLERLDPVI